MDIYERIFLFVLGIIGLLLAYQWLFLSQKGWEKYVGFFKRHPIMYALVNFKPGSFDILHEWESGLEKKRSKITGIAYLVGGLLFLLSAFL